VTCKGGVLSLPAVLALWDARVYVSILNGSDKATNVEASIDKCLSSCTTLRVSYAYLDNYHIRLRENLNNVRFGCNVDIVEDVH